MTKISFSHFVILASMRTGSNLLERTLNSVEGVFCHGELFNPVFMGRPKLDECFGISQKNRDVAPLELITAMQQEGGEFPGYRHFDGHDARVLEHVLADPACAKIVLTRNPVDSFISLKLARTSGQWMLTTHRNKSAATQIEFDAEEFSDFVDGRSAFLGHIRKALQTTGQTAFEIDYEELQDADVLNGLLRFLGLDRQPVSPDSTLKKQNTSELRDKVRNFDELQRAVSEDALAALDSPRLVDSPRGPAVRSYLAAPAAGLIYVPVPGGPGSEIEDWLSEVEKKAGGSLMRAMTQRQLRELRASHPGLRSFTVLRHPVLRAFAAFRNHTTPGADGYRPGLEELLERRFGLNPKKGTDSLALRRQTFLAYLRLLKSTLAGQSGIGIAPPWRTQLSVLQGVGRVTVPDFILREEGIATDIAHLCKSDECPSFQIPQQDIRAELDEICDAAVEKLTRSVYARDYSAFGFPDWTADA